MSSGTSPSSGARGTRDPRPDPHRPAARRVQQWRDVLENLHHVAAREATVDELELVHPTKLVDAVQAASPSSGPRWVGPEARASAGSWEASLVAIGGLLEAVERVVAGEIGNAFVCCRPPGHHATAEQAMGFCLFNGVAIAARYLQSRHGLGRVAIVDWDVHHGNSTQDIFYDGYRLAFEQIVAPAVERFRPDFILVSTG